jgi:hypothetical protein
LNLRLRVALAAVAMLAGRPAHDAPAATPPSVSVEGTQFRGILDDGRVLAQDALPPRCDESAAALIYVRSLAQPLTK